MLRWVVSLMGALAIASMAVAEENKVVFEIAPTKEIPRNSEGDFIQLKSGQILFIYTEFYGGAGDHSAARLVSVQSADAGLTWTREPKLVVENTGEQNVMSVSLLRLRNGQIGLFYLVKNNANDCRPVVRYSSDEAATWSEPISITAVPGYYVLNNDRMIQLKNGRILMPLAFHKARGVPGLKTSFGGRAISLWYFSDDNGQNWREADDWWTLNVPTRTGLQEPGVVELGDGTVWSWARTDQRYQFGCLSTNAGRNWTGPEPTALRSPASPASIEKLPGTSHLLAIYNDVSNSSPEMEAKRTPLVAAISKDNGKTWGRPHILENDPDGWYCYTAIEFVKDSVLLAYCAGSTKDKIGGGLGRLRMKRLSLASLSE